MPTQRTAIKTGKKATATGIVEDTKTYTVDALCDTLGVEERTVRDARAAGLPAHLMGGRRLVISGVEYNRWVRESAPLAPTPMAKNESPAN